MVGLVFFVLFLAMAGHSSGTWCVCKTGVSDAVLQKTLDYACGAGADCTLIHQNGGCYNPNTLRAHCNYAVNSYFQKKGQAAGSCDFAGTASISTSDPSSAGCIYPSTASSGSTTPTPVTTMNPTPTTPTTTTNPTPSITTPGSNSPYSTTPSAGILGSGNNGLGPSGAGINTDTSHGGLNVQNPSFLSLLWFMCPGLLFLWS